MVDQEAIWHAIIEDKERGPLTKAQVLEYLRNNKLTGSDLIWRAGFPDWKLISEVSEFWQPPKRTSSTSAGQTQTVLQSTVPYDQDKDEIKTLSSGGERWSLWKTANVGLLVSAFMLSVQIAGGRGFELANYAHTASAATIGGLLGQILAAPLIFVLAGVIQNLIKRRQPKSNASALRSAVTFVVLLGSIVGSLKVYGETFFSSSEVISGETRKVFVADVSRACVQKQRQIGQSIAETDRYCNCVAEKTADSTTYKQLGAELDVSALADLRQRVEAAGFACR